MKNLIRKILKESIDNFDWVGDVKQFTPAEQFLYDLMSELTIVESKKWINWMVYKDENGKILMADNINTANKNHILLVDYNQIWLKLRDIYDLSHGEVMALCMRMLEITYKRKVLTAVGTLRLGASVLEMTHKRKVLTVY